jgi:hypothetical protein
LTGLADVEFLHGDPSDGFALLDRAQEQALAEEHSDLDLSLRIDRLTAD